MKKLEKLKNKYDGCRAALDNAIDNVEMEIAKISGIDNIQCNDLANDGLGVRIDEDDNGNTHVSIRDLVETLEKTGIITREDLEKTSF